MSGVSGVLVVLHVAVWWFGRADHHSRVALARLAAAADDVGGDRGTQHLTPLIF